MESRRTTSRGLALLVLAVALCAAVLTTPANARAETVFSTSFEGERLGWRTANARAHVTDASYSGAQAVRIARRLDGRPYAFFKRRGIRARRGATYIASVSLRVPHGASRACIRLRE